MMMDFILIKKKVYYPKKKNYPIFITWNIFGGIVNYKWNNHNKNKKR